MNRREFITGTAAAAAIAALPEIPRSPRVWDVSEIADRVVANWRDALGNFGQEIAINGNAAVALVREGDQMFLRGVTLQMPLKLPTPTARYHFEWQVQPRSPHETPV